MIAVCKCVVVQNEEVWSVKDAMEALASKEPINLPGMEEVCSVGPLLPAAIEHSENLNNAVYLLSCYLWSYDSVHLSQGS